MSIIDIIYSIILSIHLFCYWFINFIIWISNLSVGQSLMFIIFKKLSDDDDLILRKMKMMKMMKMMTD